MSDLLEKLREVQGKTTKSYRNPEGPKAADRIEELEAEKAAIVNTYHEREMEFIAEIERLRAALKDYKRWCREYEAALQRASDAISEVL